MIKTREQRKKAATLLQRRRIAIIVSLVLVAILTVTFFLVYNHFKTVLPFKDYDGAKYQIKQVDGVYKMYYENGKLVDTVTPPGSTQFYYVTEAGTQLYIDPTTGGYEIVAIPDLYYESDGENLDENLRISIFKTVAAKEILSIEIHNQNDDYSLIRVPGGSDLAFKIAESPLSSLNMDHLSYLVQIVGDPLVTSRIDKPLKNGGTFSEYGLAPEKRVDEEGNEYDYVPTYYVVNMLDGNKHKMIIGDRLVDGSGYYAQYENKDGVKRDAVYVYSPPDMSQINQTGFEKTVLAPAKDIILPNIGYFGDSNSYHEVENFSISQNVEGSFEELINFSYVAAEDRTGTTQSIHPYVFQNDLKGYHPNYDNILAMFSSLVDPDIVGVAALSPSAEDKLKYGLKDGDQNISEYTIEFDRIITITYTDDDGKEKTSNEKVHQTVYISKENEDGNRYVFTELRFLETADDSKKKGVSLDTICEVSGETLNFLTYDRYNWIYTSFMQLKIDYLASMEIISADYSAKFDITRKKLAGSTIMEIAATDSLGNAVNTFGGRVFVDSEGYYWIVTPAVVKKVSKDGKTEIDTDIVTYEHNALGEQIKVTTAGIKLNDGSYLNVFKDEIIITKPGGGTEKLGRHRYDNTLFKYLYSWTTTESVVDDYKMTDEEEQALISNPENKIVTVKLTDTDGVTYTYNFYNLTARKSYLTIGDEEEIGGFYTQATRLTKLISDAKKFFAGEIIDMNSHK